MPQFDVLAPLALQRNDMSKITNDTSQYRTKQWSGRIDKDRTLTHNVPGIMMTMEN